MGASGRDVAYFLEEVAAPSSLHGIDALSCLGHFEAEPSERIERALGESDCRRVQRLAIGCSVRVKEDQATVGVTAHDQRARVNGRSVTAEDDGGRAR